MKFAALLLAIMALTVSTAQADRVGNVPADPQVAVVEDEQGRSCTEPRPAGIKRSSGLHRFPVV